MISMNLYISSMLCTVFLVQRLSDYIFLGQVPIESDGVWVYRIGLAISVGRVLHYVRKWIRFDSGRVSRHF